MEDLIWKVQDAFNAKNRIKELEETLELFPDVETEADLITAKKELPGLIGEGLMVLDQLKDLLILQNHDVLDTKNTLNVKEVYESENLENVNTNAKSKSLKDAKSFVKKSLGVKVRTKRSKEQIAGYWTACIKKITDWNTIKSVPGLLRAVGDERGWRIKEGGNAKDIMGKWEYSFIQAIITANRGY